MITELVGWFGKYRIIYDDLVREWKSASEDIDAYEVDCAEHDLPVASDGRLYLDPADELFIDNGGLFGGRTLVLNNAEAWEFKVKGPRNTRPLAIQQVIDHLREIQTPVRLGLVYRTSHASDSIEDQCDPFTDHGIPADSDGMAEWIRDYLKRCGVRISPKQRDWIVEHVGLDKQQLVEMVVSLAKSTSGDRVTSDDIERAASKMGAVEGYRIMMAVTQGRRAEAAETFERVLNKGMDIIPMNAMLLSRFRKICVATDADADLKIVAENTNSHYGIMREARSIGPRRAARCLSLLAENDYNIKGMGELDPVLSTRITIDRIAQICSR